MFFARRSELPALAPGVIRGLRFSLNTPVVRTEDLPAAPARAAILLYAPEGDGALPLVGIRSLKSGEVVYFEPEGALDDEGLDAAMAFGEGMGFLFDDEELDQGDAERAFGMWTDLMVDSPAASQEPLLPTVEPDPAEVLLTEEVSLDPIDDAAEISLPDVEPDTAELSPPGVEPAVAEASLPEAQLAEVEQTEQTEQTERPELAESGPAISLPDLVFEEAPATAAGEASNAPVEALLATPAPEAPVAEAHQEAPAPPLAEASEAASTASAPASGTAEADGADEMPELVLPTDDEVDLPELILPEDRAAREAAEPELPDLSQPLGTPSGPVALTDAPSAPSLPPAVPLEIPGTEASPDAAVGPSLADLQPDITQPPVPPDTQQLTSMIEDALLGAEPQAAATPLPPAQPLEIPEEPGALPLTKFRMDSLEEEVTAAPDPALSAAEVPEPSPTEPESTGASAQEPPPPADAAAAPAKSRKERRRAALGRLRLVKKKRPIPDDDPRRQFLARILSAF